MTTPRCSLDISVLSLKGSRCPSQEDTHMEKELLVFPALQLAAAPDLPSPPWQQFSSQRSNTDTSQEKMLRRAVGSRARGIQGDLSRPRCRAQHGVAGDGAKSKNCHHQLQKITGERNFPRAWTRLQALVLRSSQKSQGQVCRAGERLRLGAPKLGDAGLAFRLEATMEAGPSPSQAC